MNTFIGINSVKLTPMTHQEYNDYRGWTLPADENGDDKGYLVESTLNHTNWLPKHIADMVYKHTQLTFGQAIEYAKQGHKIARQGWNGKNMWVVYMPPLYLPPANTTEPGPRVNERTAQHIGYDQPLDCQPYFAMYNAQKQWIPGWVASQSDMLAEDWYVHL